MTSTRVFKRIIKYEFYSNGSRKISFTGSRTRNVFAARHTLFFEPLFNVKGETKHAGVVQATEEEKRYTARNVELFRCTKCGFPERFPRYNDPIKLLATRRGRCG